MKFSKWKSIVLALLSISLVSCGPGSGSNPEIDGVDGPNVEYVGGKIHLSMVLKNVTTEGGVVIPIPKYPNSSLQVGPDFNSAGTLVMLTIDAPDWMQNKGDGLDPQTLPGGRPLPGVAAGSMPAIALLIPSLNNSVLYVGPEIIGFFMPMRSLDTGGAIVSFRFHNKAGEPVGTLSLVGADQNGNHAGILAMMNADLLGISGEAKKRATLYRYAISGKY